MLRQCNVKKKLLYTNFIDKVNYFKKVAYKLSISG